MESSSLEERMRKMEDAYGTQSELMRELRDAVTVTAHLEARHSEVLKDHSDWLSYHDQAMKEHTERMKELDERIARTVSGIGEFMGRSK